MNRRQLMQGIVALSAASILPGCSPKPLLSENPFTSIKGNFFDKHQMTLISNIVDLILPETSTPGALKVGVPQVLDTVLAEFSSIEDQTRWQEGLTLIAHQLQGDGNASFYTLAKWLRVEKLAEFDENACGKNWFGLGAIFGREEENLPTEHSLYRELKSSAISAFYLSQEGATKELRYEPIPGTWEPCIPYNEGEGAWLDIGATSD